MKTLSVQSKPLGLTFALLTSLLPWAPLLAEESDAPITIRVPAMVDALVTETQVQVGDKVDRGQVLLRLDSRKYEIHVAIAEARADAAEGELMIRMAELAVAQVSLETVKKQPGASASEVKAAETAVKVGEGQLRRAEALMKAARMKVELHEIELSRCHVLAPVSGTVKSMAVQMGEAVSRQQVVVAIERDS